MGRILVPAGVVSAFLAFAVAAFSLPVMTTRGVAWEAALHLVVLGAFIPAIYAVNIRIVPVFSRRDWPSMPALRLQMVATIGAAWSVYFARLERWQTLDRIGSVVAFAAALLFTVNIIRLFRQKTMVRPALPLPYPDQAKIDRVAIQFTRLSGMWLLIGLSVGVMLSFRNPGRGRWDLVWAHSLLIGFVLTMIAGVAYHVMARWSDRRWRSVTFIKVHFGLTLIGAPAMVLALALDENRLFSLAGPIQVAALLLFIFNVAPMAFGLPTLTKVGFLSGASFLVIGLMMGLVFAFEPSVSARLRLAHASSNLFGWGGLVLTGIAYFLVPRFAGNALRWPRLAMLQIILLNLGAISTVALLAARGYGRDVDSALRFSAGATGIAFLIAALILALTFAGHRRQPVQAVSLQIRPLKRSVT